MTIRGGNGGKGSALGASFVVVLATALFLLADPGAPHGLAAELTPKSALAILIPDLSLGCDPPALNVAAGTTGSSTCTVTSMGGFSAPVDLVCFPDPALKCSFTPAQVTPPANGSAKSRLDVTASANATPGPTHLQVFATGGGLVRFLLVSINIVVAGPDFRVSCDPSLLSIRRGTSGSSRCTVLSLNGFSSPVFLSTVGLPAGANATFNPTVVTPPPNSATTSALALTVGATPPTTYPFEARGTSGVLVRSAQMRLTVTAPAIEVAPNPTMFDFGGVPIARFSDATFTVSNAGTAPLGVGNVTVRGNGFGLVANGCTGASLSPPASCLLIVRLAPGAPGGKASGTLTIVSDDPNRSTLVIDLRGVGLVPPRLVLPAAGAVVPTRPSLQVALPPESAPSFAGLTLQYVVEFLRVTDLTPVQVHDQLADSTGWSKPSYTATDVASFTKPLSLQPGSYKWRARLRASGGLSDPSEMRDLVSSDPPVITALSDVRLLNGGRRELTISGSNFVTGTSVFLDRAGRGGTTTTRVDGKVAISTPSFFDVFFDLSDDPLGTWDLVVRNPQGLEARREIEIQPSLIFPAIEPLGVRGFPVAAQRRATALDLTNVGNDSGYVLLQLTPPAPGIIELQVGFSANILYDSRTDPNPSRVVLLLNMQRQQERLLPLWWLVPPEKVRSGALRAEVIALAEEGPIQLGSIRTVSWDGLKGATKHRLKGIVKDALLHIGCKALGQKLAGLKDGELDQAVDNVLDHLGEGGTLAGIGIEVGKALGEEVIPGFGQVKLAVEIGLCVGEFVDGVISAFEMAAKGAADRLRAATGGDQTRALARAIDEIDRLSRGRLTLGALHAVIDLNAALQKPPCSPPPRTRGAWSGPVRGPWDPNDKTFAGTYPQRTVVLDGVSRTAAFIGPADATAPILYVINFENKAQATAPAANVVITDVLDEHLDPSSFELLSTSHATTLSVQRSGRTITFRFTGINLPPNVNPPAGEGSVTFSVRPTAGLKSRTGIRNSASIVFDANPPILTPETLHLLDFDAPTTTARPTPPPNSSGWNNQVVVVRLEADDGALGSGIREIRYVLAGAETDTRTVPGSTATVAVAREGVTTLTYFAVDRVGNAEAPRSLEIRVDRTAPVTTATTSPAPNARGWWRGPVQVTLTCADALSGCARTEFSPDGAGWMPYTGAIAIASEGIHTLRYRSIDLADNLEAARELLVQIDLTPPEATIRFDPEQLDLVVLGRDDLSGVTTPGTITPSAVVPAEGNREIRTYQIEDQAGNTLELTILVKREGHEIKAELQGLRYNADPPISAVKNELKFEWALTGSAIKELEQKMEVGEEPNEQEVEAKFEAEENTTKIQVEAAAGEREFTRTGLVLLRLESNRGALAIRFD